MISARPSTTRWKALIPRLARIWRRNTGRVKISFMQYWRTTKKFPCSTSLDVIVQAADALSGARPGARREMLESYIKRLEELERIASSFSGVEKSYAIQAGREIRIVVSSEKMNDDAIFLLSKDIAKKVETELSYPGQIKIVVIRETRAVEYAR